MSGQVDHLIEIPGVYDGWSIAVIRDPYRYVNRWANGTDPLIPEPGYERRHAAVEEYIDRSGIRRGRLADIDWGTI